MSSLLCGKVEHQQGSLSLCIDHRYGATMQAGIAGSSIGIAAKNSSCLAASDAPHDTSCRCYTHQRFTCTPVPCLPFSVSLLVVMDESREMGVFASQISCENS